MEKTGGMRSEWLYDLEIAPGLSATGKAADHARAATWIYPRVMDSKLASESLLPLEGNHDASGHRVQGALIPALIGGKVLLVAWVIAGIFLYVVPAVDPPGPSDAVVVLAPILDTGRLEYAESLMADSHGTALVVSVPVYGSDKGSSDICSARRTYRIICFSPDPVTTQGEARAIQRISEEYAWRSVTVVTNDFHVTRARTIIERCYSYQLNMAAVRHDRALTGWAYRFVYESAAFVKAAVHPGC